MGDRAYEQWIAETEGWRLRGALDAVLRDDFNRLSGEIMKDELTNAQKAILQFMSTGLTLTDLDGFWGYDGELYDIENEDVARLRQLRLIQPMGVSSHRDYALSYAGREVVDGLWDDLPDGWPRCPRCGSVKSNLIAISEPDPDSLIIPAWCGHCGHQWTAEYRIGE